MKTAITSMTEDYYRNKGGKKCIETFLQNWPESIKLVVYWEGMASDWPDEEIESDRLHITDVDYVEHLPRFLEAISYFPLMSGNLGGGVYNIEYDARMCRAGLIHAHAMKTIGGKVYWMDADMITHSPVTHEFLDSILPDDKLCCCLQRPHFNTETGFLGMNAGHPESGRWIRYWQNVYTTGLIFTQQGWHDNWGFDLARHHFKQDWLFNDLAKDLPAGTMHPLICSVLGSVFDHLKGARKNGKSGKEDLTVSRTEPYWND